MKRKVLFSIIAVMMVLSMLISACAGPPATQAPAPTEAPPAATEAPPAEVESVKVGAMYPLTGDLAKLGEENKNGLELAIEEINAAGGILGRKLEPVVVDPASNWPLFAEKAKQLITQDKVAVVFGCWTSVSRKSVLPVFKELYQRVKTGKECARVLSACGAPNGVSHGDQLVLLCDGAARRGTAAAGAGRRSQVMRGPIRRW